MRRLYLVHAQRRSFYGGDFESEPSRFLGDIPRHLLQDDGEAAPRSTKGSIGTRPGVSGPIRGGSTTVHARNRDSLPTGGQGLRPQSRPTPTPAIPTQPAPQFIDNAAPPPSVTPRQGDTVRHRFYGKGVVVKVTVENDTTTVEVQFEREGLGRKTLDLHFAKLEVIE